MLFDACEELLSELPFERITVSRICARSTVNRATFYRHFPDKSSFVAAYLQTITDRFLARIAADGANLGLEEYASLMHRELIRFVEDNRDAARNAMGRRAEAETIDLLVGQISTGIFEHIESHSQSTGKQPVAPAQFTALFYSGGMMQTLRWWLDSGRPIPAEELERRCTALLMAQVSGR